MPAPDNPLMNVVRYTLEYLGLGRVIAPFPIRREARPWRVSEISIKNDWPTGAPDYVGIGTQKSGTSWWASLIEQHPDVVPNQFQRKEMHYLAHFLERELTPGDIATYHAVFARPNGKKCGEWTPNYMANPHAVVQLGQAAPEARILLMLRNPIDRYESGINHERKQRFGGMIGPRVRMEVVKGYALRTEAIWNGMYGAQLETVLKIFPAEQVLVLQYEKCKAAPKEMIRKTYRFLGLDESFAPTGITRKVNEQRRIQGCLSNKTRELLATIYAADAKRLVEQLVERNCGTIELGLWAGFESAG